jgi:hypothetical protein
MKSMEDFNSEDMVNMLISISETNPDAFVDVTLQILIDNEDSVISDSTPTNIKLGAISYLMNQLIEREEYENCAILQRIANKIKDADAK